MFKTETILAAPESYLTADTTDPHLKEVATCKTLQGALIGLSASSMYRAGLPLENHAWVYAAAMAVSSNVGQVPFVIYRETEDTLRQREAFSLKNYKIWKGPARGCRRTAIQRHLLQRKRFSGAKLRGLEPDYLHPLTQTFTRVNPHMVDSQLWQLTTLDLMTKGESFWRLLNENGEPIGIGEMPAIIWPTNPSLINPIIIGGQFIGWKFIQRKTDGTGGYAGRVQNLQIWQIVQFKFIDPENPLRGLSPLIPIASNIKLDMTISDHTQAILSNGGDPGGLLINKEGFENPEEEKEFLAKFEQRHQGEKNPNRTGILSGGWEYHQTGMTPRDMDYPDLRIFNRDEVLAAMRTPKTVVGVTDTVNYATQLGQDKNFWDKTVIPILKYIETVIDGTLLFEEPDSVVGAFDLSGVDALRAGLKDQIEIANSMAGPNLHTPPDIAYGRVGLDVEDYEGSNECFISPILTPVKDIKVMADVLDQPPVLLEETTTQEPKSLIENKIAIIKKVSKEQVWRNFIKTLHSPMMLRTSVQWKKYIRVEKKLQLQAFDNIAEGKSWENATIALREFISEDGYKPYTKAISAESILLDVEESGKRLGIKIRPVYDKALTDTYDYTVNELGGIAVFELDDPEIIEFYNTAERKLVGTAPVTLSRNVLSSVRAGIEAGETIGEIRLRVGKVYDIAGSSPKSLQIARTESTSFLNGARKVMHKKAKIEETEWVTANDENVRENHSIYGGSGNHPIEFNYLTLVGVPGSLTYPGDKNAPASEIINCRCTKIPVI